jgi:anti-anti-sigma factor
MHPSDSPIDVHNLRIETADSEHSVRVVLHGEADIATLQRLETSLARVVLDHVKHVDLDLTGLDFADVSSLRQLATFAREAKQAGRSVRSRGARPILRKVARLMSVHDDLGLA